MWIYHGEEEVYTNLPSSSAAATAVPDVGDAEMADVLLDLANEMRNADDDDNIEGIDLVDPDSSAYASIFEELQSELYPGVLTCLHLIFLLK